ncbi:MAG: hypothetical protein E6Q94_02395 [Burkholderiaceae bacterium]|nr:MAG: hypothetical protein E6Q94_02395 [Burkholderiaceae bacterium]
MQVAKNLDEDHVRYRVAVLLSAHGRSPYLREQVASIRAALTPDDILVVVDDGSAQVDWSSLHGELPHNYLCWSRLKGLGSSLSFMDLLCNLPIRASYYSWADQDDRWCKDKLSCQLQWLATKPDAWACVHGWRPLRLGQDGKWITDAPQAPTVQRSAAHYCFETPAPGMTLCMTEEARQQLMALDRQLLKRLLADMPHDRLACAVLGLSGRLQLVADVLVDYRQHSENLIGAPPSGRLARATQRIQRWRSFWRTARAGGVLYRQLVASGLGSGQALPRLTDQRLRASGGENWILQAWLRWYG